MGSKTRGNYSFSECLNDCHCPKCRRERLEEEIKEKDGGKDHSDPQTIS